MRELETDLQSQDKCIIRHFAQLHGPNIHGKQKAGGKIDFPGFTRECPRTSDHLLPICNRMKKNLPMRRIYSLIWEWPSNPRSESLREAMAKREKKGQKPAQTT